MNEQIASAIGGAVVGGVLFLRLVHERNDHEETHHRETIKRLKTEIAINHSIIRTIEEIQEMHESGVLPDREFIALCKRIGW